MINVYTKAGILEGNQVITFILKSQKHTWTKAIKIDFVDIPSNSFSRKITIDAISILTALKHIKNKYKKKKVVIYSDSPHIKTSLAKKGEKYLNKTKLDAVEKLRDYVDSFNNISIFEFKDECKHLEDLEHIFIECALDNIEINDKE